MPIKSLAEATLISSPSGVAKFRSFSTYAAFNDRASASNLFAGRQMHVLCTCEKNANEVGISLFLECEKYLHYGK